MGSEKDVPELKNLQQLFFELPLYQKVKFLDDINVSNSNSLTVLGNPLLLSFLVSTSVYGTSEYVEDVWDNYCPECGQSATFHALKQSSSHWIDYSDAVSTTYSNEYVNTTLTCSRSQHLIRFYFHVDGLYITKIGQLPSLADIANDEAQKYRKFMSKEDAREFHKAIGLAANGVGIGSFVYLRRIFENLVSAQLSSPLCLCQF